MMSSSITRTMATLTAAVSVIALAPSASADDLGRTEPGSEGVGDSYFPNLGNGGYDVRSNTLTTSHAAVPHPAPGSVEGVPTRHCGP